MGIISTISYDRFPSQGKHLNRRVDVCFDYNSSKTVGGTIIRQDQEFPGLTLIRLDDGRVVRDVECQYSIHAEFENLVFCGFPGIGKSTVYSSPLKFRRQVLDSDSSRFDKSKFPGNYVQHIADQTQLGNIVLASSHDAVRTALVDAKIPFHLVYPDIALKDEYMARYEKRGSPQAFLNLMDKNWDQFINSCVQQPGCGKTVLGSGMYLSDCPEIQKLMAPTVKI